MFLIFSSSSKSSARLLITKQGNQISSSSVSCLGFNNFRAEEFCILAGEEGVKLKELINGVSLLEMEGNDSFEVYDASTTFFF